MLKAGSFSRWLAGAFVIGSIVVGGVAAMTDTQSAANLTNGFRDVGETGAGVLVGSASGAGGSFEEAMEIASAQKSKQG